MLFVGIRDVHLVAFYVHVGYYLSLARFIFNLIFGHIDLRCFILAVFLIRLLNFNQL
jgi:hypothetical protein